MEQAVLVLEYAVAASFVLLALLTLERWLTFRGRSRGFLALAIGLLALSTVLGRIGPLFPSTAVVVGDLTIVAFMASGFALLLFRHSTMRLPGWALQLAFAAAAVTTVLALIFLPQTGTQPTPLQSAVTIAFVLVWCALVGEPAVRMWLLARGRPAVQRARLRALSAGYATFIFILLVVGFDTAFSSDLLAQVVIQVIALATVPILYASFAPPQWLRRFWREPEEQAFRSALQDLVLFSPDRRTMAQRGLDWALRLVGAGGGLVADEHGEILAIHGIEETRGRELLARLGPVQPTSRLVESTGSEMIVPLLTEKGTGALVLVAGPFTPIFGSDEVARVWQYAAAMRIALDRTAMMEKISAVERTKSQFLNLASHELRTPLSVIRGYLSLFDEGSLGRLTPTGQKVLTVLNAKALEMNLLVEQMLEAARLEDGRLALRMEPIDLGEAAASAVDIVRALADSEHPLKLERPAQPVMVSADRDRVATILTNLLDNAIKYSPSGGEVRCGLTVEDGLARVAVSDHGLGIAAADQAQLFTRFGRITTKENSHISGTGLGLYLSRELARQHGGDLTVESIPGQGSTFTLSMPLLSQPAHQAATTRADAAAPAEATTLKTSTTETAQVAASARPAPSDQG
jgi:signal transduction histidine kinase